jgi:hypothetical protein
MKKTVEQQLKETVQSLRTKLVTEKSNLSEWEFLSPSSWGNGRGYGDATSRDDARKQDMSKAQINTLRTNASKIMPGIVTTAQDPNNGVWYGLDKDNRHIAIIVNGEWQPLGGQQAQAAPSSSSGASGNPVLSGSTTPDPAKLEMFKQLLTKAGVYTPPAARSPAASNTLLRPDAYSLNNAGKVFKNPIGTDFTLPMPEPAPMKTQEGFLRDALLEKLRLLEDDTSQIAAGQTYDKDGKPLPKIATAPAVVTGSAALDGTAPGADPAVTIPGGPNTAVGGAGVVPAPAPKLTAPEYKLLSRLYGEFKVDFPNNPEVQPLLAAYDKVAPVWNTPSTQVQPWDQTSPVVDAKKDNVPPVVDAKKDSKDSEANDRITKKDKREYEKGTMGTGSRDGDSTSGPTGVSDLQNTLVEKGYLPKYHADKKGIFGDATKYAVIKLQTELKSNGAVLGTSGPNGDGIDGVFGQQTSDAAKNKLNFQLTHVGDVRQSTLPPAKPLPPAEAPPADATKTDNIAPPAVVAGANEMNKFKTVAEVDAAIKDIKDKGLDRGNSLMQLHLQALEARKSVLQAAGGISADPLASTVPGPGDSVLKFDAKYTDKGIPPRPTIGKPVGVGPGTNRPATQADIEQWDKNWKMSHFADGKPMSGGDLQLSPDWATIDPGMAAILKGIKVKKVDGVWTGTEKVKDPKSGDMKVARALAPQVIKALDELARKEATNMHPNAMQKESVGYVNDDLKRIVSLVHHR